MQGQLACFAELAEPHGEPSGGEVDVCSVQRDRFPDPDPGHGEQPNQGGERGAPQGGGSDCAAPISAAMSASEYKYGLARIGLCVSSSGAGTSCIGSSAWR